MLKEWLSTLPILRRISQRSSTPDKPNVPSSLVLKVSSKLVDTSDRSIAPDKSRKEPDRTVSRFRYDKEFTSSNIASIVDIVKRKRKLSNVTHSLHHMLDYAWNILVDMDVSGIFAAAPVSAVWSYCSVL